MQTKPNKAFTLVELLVAMALMMILTAMASLIFAAAVRGYRTADSAMEITRRAEVICGQLSADVGGLQTNAPLMIWFEVDPATGKRYDQIQFFANGDFQTIKQYDTNADNLGDKTVSGLVSRIQYGHALQVNLNQEVVPPAPWAWAFQTSYTQAGLLSRRTHLMTEDMTPLVHPLYKKKDGTWTGPEIVYPFPMDPTNPFVNNFKPVGNNLLEFDRISLSDWLNLVQTTANNNQILQTCFNNTGTFNPLTVGRPVVDMKKIDTLHLLLSEQVSDFQVQWAYKSEDQIKNPATGATFGVNERFSGVRWWPDYSQGDFFQAGFGAYLNMPGGVSGAMSGLWKTVGIGGHQSDVLYFSPTYFPAAMKFTFTVHDAKGLFPNGRTFTHIVMINN